MTMRSRTDVMPMFWRSECQLRAIVERHVDGTFGRGEQQPRLLRILADRIHRFSGRNAVDDLRPGLAAVVRAQDVRTQIVEPQRIDRGVGGLRD